MSAPKSVRVWSKGVEHVVHIGDTEALGRTDLVVRRPGSAPGTAPLTVLLGVESEEPLAPWHRVLPTDKVIAAIDSPPWNRGVPGIVEDRP